MYDRTAIFRFAVSPRSFLQVGGSLQEQQTVSLRATDRYYVLNAILERVEDEGLIPTL